MQKIILLTLFALSGAWSAAAVDIAIKEQAPQTPTPELKISLFAVTQGAPIPFRFRGAESEEVVGYFPANTVVEVMYWSNPWVLLSYQDMAGWVKNDDIKVIITPDGRSWLAAPR
jgi:hypothetical protein